MIMRRSSMPCPMFDFVTGVLMFGLFCCFSSCVDDTFGKYGQSASGPLSFAVNVPDGWTNGSSTRVADKDISIKKMSQSGGGKSLYLVTEISEAAVDTVASDAVTRGKPVEDVEAFAGNSFGLSAICYTGDWPENDTENKWTTNFAHNVKVSTTDKGATWKPAIPLHWLGSGNLRFFAYSPYSATGTGSSTDNAESDKTSDVAAEYSITHSRETETGIPTLTYTVPDDVTKQVDLMVATADCKGDGTGTDANAGTVSLKFTHALTSVTIKTGEKMLAGKVTGISISGVYGSGTYRIGADKWTTTGESNRTFTINNETKLPVNSTGEEPDEIMTGSGTVLNKDEYTFMMIPQTLPDGAKLQISFIDSLTGTSRTLTAELKGSTWPVGKKVTYSVNSTGIVIEPVIELTINRANTLYPNGGYKGREVPRDPNGDPKSLYEEMTEAEKLAYLPVSGLLNDVSIASYIRVLQAGAESEAAKEQIRKLDFKIEWSVDNGASWHSSESGSKKMGWRPATILQSTADENDWTKPVSGSILLPAQNQFTYMQEFLYGKQKSIDNYRAETITSTGKGSETEPYDLVENNEVAQESANCYIVNDHGYYKFPAYYGNTYNKAGDTSSYKYAGNIEDVPEGTRNFVLTDFVGYDNQPISEGAISGVTDAILLWQDSPDLVTDVKYSSDGWVSFRVPEETINQGNAVIAVRKGEDILWSWHIWVTHRQWNSSSCVQLSDENKNENGKPFIIVPCNLGYCEPHEEDAEREVLMRFVATSIPVGDDGVILKKQITIEGVPWQSTESEKGAVIAFTQPKIVASAAGDNTYYQWGRKDPMLPGIHNSDTYNNSNTEFDMVNKVFYSKSEERYRFTSSESARSIGDGIKYPNEFFMHKRPQNLPTNPTDEQKAKYEVENYKRRHWHDGTISGYSGVATDYNKKTVMNYWNTQLVESANAGFNHKVGMDVQNYKEPVNGKYVVKTIYDPSPAGFKIPPLKAFADFFDTVKLTFKTNTDNSQTTICESPNAIYINSPFAGWKVSVLEREFYFPATGVRDMGTYNTEVKYGTFPSFSSITYIATSGFHKGDGASSSCLIFSIDKRSGNFTNCTTPIQGTNNAYGFTVRPICDGQTGN